MMSHHMISFSLIATMLAELVAPYMFIIDSSQLTIPRWIWGCDAISCLHQLQNNYKYLLKSNIVNSNTHNTKKLCSMWLASYLWHPRYHGQPKHLLQVYDWFIPRGRDHVSLGIPTLISGQKLFQWRLT